MIETISLFGRPVSLYYLFWFLAMLSAIITGWCLRKDYGFSFSRSTIYAVLDLILGYLLIWVTAWLFGGFKVKGFNFARIVSFVPLYFILLAYVFKESLWKLSDFLAPVGAMFFGTSHFGCIFAGCCHGYPAGWGLYSNTAKTVCFPSQPIEAVVSLLIGAVLFVMAKKKIQQGRLYIWFMILFGDTRFILEFFRGNEKIWCGISELAFHSLAAMILGLAALVILKQADERNPDYEKN